MRDVSVDISLEKICYEGVPLQRLPIHRTLAFRLFVVISAMLAIALGINAWQNASSFHSMLLLNIQEKTMQNARRTANGADAVIDSWVSQLIVITNGLSGASRDRYAEIIRGFAASNPEFISVELLLEPKTGAKIETLTRAILPDPTDERYMAKDADEVARDVSDEAKRWLDRSLRTEKNAPSLLIGNMSTSVQVPALAVALSFPIQGTDQKLWALLTTWQSKLYAALSSGGSDSVLLLDARGRIVSASDVDTLVTDKKSYAKHPLLVDAGTRGSSSGFKQWQRSKEELILGAYAVLPKFGLTAITESDGRPAYDAVRKILMRSLLWATLLLLISVLISSLASSGITKNLRKLVDTTLQIAGGDFKARVSVGSKDEVGRLGAAVNHMGAQIEGLMAERLEKARLEAELQTAKMVQDAFFPKNQEPEEHFQLTSFFQPASECGGDWWGTYRLSPHHRLVCIADATGHGVPAALVTAMVFAAASVMSRRYIEGDQTEYSPAELLLELNKTLCATSGTKLTMTFFALVFDLKKGTMRFANAGHNFPILIRKEVSPQQRVSLQSINNPLGMYEDSTFENGKDMPILPGDRILFYTDGLIECTNKEEDQWGRRRLLKTLQKHQDEPVEQFKDSLLKTAYDHFAGYPAADDLTVVITEVSEKWSAEESPAPLKEAS